MRVAILGTGKMGAAMARRLDDMGLELVLWNRTRARAEAVGAGEVRPTPADAVRDADVVISMLTDAAAVRGAYLGAGGAVEAAGGQIFAEMSTTGGDINREIAEALARKGAHFIEAPVLGSVGAMAAGTGVVLAAGDESSLERARPVLESFGEVRRIGPLGSAAALKLIANTMLAGVYALTAELMAAGVGAGLQVEDVFFVLNRIAPLLTQRKQGFVEHRYEPVTFAMRDIMKDLELAEGLFGRLHATTPMSDLARELFARAAGSHMGDEMTAVASLYENRRA